MILSRLIKILSAIFLLLITSCLTDNRVMLSPEESSLLQPGDVVRVLTKDGGEFEMRLTTVTSTYLEGDGRRIDRKFILAVEKVDVDQQAVRQFGAGALLVGLVALGVIIVFVEIQNATNTNN